MGLRLCANCGNEIEDGTRPDAIYCHRPECKRQRAYKRQRASMERTGKVARGSTGRGSGNWPR